MGNPNPEVREVEVSYPVYDNMPPGPDSGSPQTAGHHWNIRIDQVDQPERERRLLSSPMEQILANCALYPPIDHDQSVELVERSRAGDKDARAELTLHFQRFVIHFAKENYPQARRLNVPMEDITQDGMTGLIKAADKTDPEIAKNIEGAIRSYFSLGIKREIKRGLSDRSRLIRLPVHVHEQARSLVAVSSRLRDELGREPTEFEVADAAGLMPPKPPELIGLDEAVEYDEFRGRRPEYVINRSRSEHAKARVEAAEMVRSILSAERPVKSLDSYIRDPRGEIRPLHDVVKDDNNESEILDQVTLSVLRDNIANALDELPERDQLVLELRYGLDGDEPKTFDQTAAIVGVSRERIRQIQGKALEKLQMSEKMRTAGALRSESSEELKFEATHRPSFRTYTDSIGELISAHREGRDPSYWVTSAIDEIALQEQRYAQEAIAQRKKEIAAANASRNLYTLAKDYINKTENGTNDIESPKEEAEFVATYQKYYEIRRLFRDKLDKRAMRRYGGLVAFTALSFKPDNMPHLKAWKIARRTFLDTIRNFENNGQRLPEIYVEAARESFKPKAS